MNDYVAVKIPVHRDVAELLRDKRRADRIGRLVSEVLLPSSPASDPLPALIAEAKADARAGGMTEAGIDANCTATNAERWVQENRPAMDAWNDYVEQHGLPLAEFRQFCWPAWTSIAIQAAPAATFLTSRPPCSNT